MVKTKNTARETSCLILLPWSPSHVDRNKKKCLWKLFLFPSNKCYILGFNSSVQRFFLAHPACDKQLPALEQPWEQWWGIIYAPSFYFVPFLLSCSELHFKLLFYNGKTYFTRVSTWTMVLCLNAFPAVGFGSVLRCVCGQWIIVREFELLFFAIFWKSHGFVSFNLQRAGWSLGITCQRQPTRMVWFDS